MVDFVGSKGEANESEKKLKSLLKKEDQIKKLVEKKQKGEKLEKNQVMASFSVHSVFSLLFQRLFNAFYFLFSFFANNQQARQDSNTWIDSRRNKKSAIDDRSLSHLFYFQMGQSHLSLLLL